MPEQPPQKQNIAPDFSAQKNIAENGVKPEPKIRTMESDIQAVFKEGKESLVSAVAKEEAAKKFPHVPKPPPSKSKAGLLIFSLGMGTVIIAGVGIYFGFFYEKKTEPSVPIEQTVIPRPFFAMEKSRNIIVRSFSFLNFPQDLTIIENDTERDGSFKRIVLLLKDSEEYLRLANADEFFRAANLTPSRPLSENLEGSFNFFLYYQGGGNVRRGVVLPVGNELRAFRAMLEAEATLRSAWGALYEPTDPRGTVAAFEDITYRNIDIRRLQLSEPDDLGLYYAVFKPKKYLVITTSLESMKAAIDRIFDSF